MSKPPALQETARARLFLLHGLAAVLALVAVSACGDDGDGASGSGAAGPTGSQSGSGASAMSATSSAAGGSGGAAGALPACTEDLLPAEGPTDLVISEVHLGNFVEVFNPTAQDVALVIAPHYLCNRPDYASVSSVGPEIVVPAGGYRSIPWPSGFMVPNPAIGEMALYTAPEWEIPANLLDYVCWGSGHTFGEKGNSRKDVAVTAGQWSGNDDPCVAAPTNGALRRLPQNRGELASEWDGTVTPEATDCAPQPMK
jgi:hypothetical protein